MQFDQERAAAVGLVLLSAAAGGVLARFFWWWSVRWVNSLAWGGDGEPVAWRVFSEDQESERDAREVLAAGAGEAAERFAAEWDRDCGDGISTVHRVGLVGPDGIAVFFVYGSPGEPYRAVAGYFRGPWSSRGV